MEGYEGREGVWMLYGWGHGFQLVQIYPDVADAVRDAAKRAYVRVGFLPFDMTFQDAVKWWEGREDTKNEPYATPTPIMPIEWLRLKEVIVGFLNNKDYWGKEPGEMAEYLTNEISVEFLQRFKKDRGLK